MTAKILIADDSATIRKIVAMAFEAEDEVVEGVSNGQEALDRIPEFQPDILLADIEMPEINGFDLSRQVKSNPEWQHIKILLLSSDFEEFNQEKFLESRADGHIGKPFKSDDVIHKIRGLLSGEAEVEEDTEETALDLAMDTIVNEPPEEDIIALGLTDAVTEENEEGTEEDDDDVFELPASAEIKVSEDGEDTFDTSGSEEEEDIFEFPAEDELLAEDDVTENEETPEKSDSFEEPEAEETEAEGTEDDLGDSPWLAEEEADVFELPAETEAVEEGTATVAEVVPEKIDLPEEPVDDEVEAEAEAVEPEAAESSDAESELEESLEESSDAFDEKSFDESLDSMFSSETFGMADSESESPQSETPSEEELSSRPIEAASIEEVPDEGEERKEELPKPEALDANEPEPSPTSLVESEDNLEIDSEEIEDLVVEDEKVLVEPSALQEDVDEPVIFEEEKTITEEERAEQDRKVIAGMVEKSEMMKELNAPDESFSEMTGELPDFDEDLSEINVNDIDDESDLDQAFYEFENALSSEPIETMETTSENSKNDDSLDDIVAEPEDLLEKMAPSAFSLKAGGPPPESIKQEQDAPVQEEAARPRSPTPTRFPSPTPVPRFQAAEDPFVKVVGERIKGILEQSLDTSIEKEVDGLSEIIVASVREIVREITPHIARAVIKEEIERIKQSEDL